MLPAQPCKPFCVGEREQIALEEESADRRRPCCPRGVSAFTSFVKKITILPFLSMSVGWPKFATSSGLISVSNIVANPTYSASVKPPAGLVVSATTIAVLLTAATRATRGLICVHAKMPCALSVTSVPTATLPGIVASDALCWRRSRAAGNQRRELASRRLAQPGRTRPAPRSAAARSASSEAGASLLSE